MNAMGRCPPRGFDISVERGTKGIDGWVILEDDAVVEARLVGVRSKEYELELLEPCYCLEESGDPFKGKRVKLPAGSRVLMGMREEFAGLESYAKDGGVYDVWFWVKGKGKDGRWRIDGPRIRVVKGREEVPL